MSQITERWRPEFPILAETTYLISHSLGAMPRATFDAVHEYAEMWATRGVRAWAEGWWEMPLTIGDEVARIIGAPAGTVAMHQNVSVCQSLILSCFDLSALGARDKVVFPELEFPSVQYVYREHARAGALRLEVVPSDDGMTIDTQRMVDAIDEETLLVPISHVLFKSGALMDVAPIVEKAHAVGALVVLDTYQSAGTVPFSVTDLDVDFCTGGSVKWLCGGPGAGYLYVHPRHHATLQPRVTGWMAHEAPFAFEPDQRYAPGIARFLHGSPPVPALYAARSGYAVINEVGVPAIRELSQRRTQRLIELADAADGLTVTSPRDPEARGGTITIDVPDAAAVTAELVRRGTIVDYRPGAGIRISPNFYNTDDEVEQAVEQLAELVRTRSYDGAVAGAAF